MTIVCLDHARRRAQKATSASSGVTIRLAGVREIALA
jgi:hypothetical protein